MIVAVRHPKPDISPGICYGRLDVAPEMPMMPAPDDVHERLGKIDRIVSSPLRRAHVFARALAATLGLDVELEPRLQEMDFGRWEGVAWQDIPRGEIDAWAIDPLAYRPGGGETVDELNARVLAVRREWMETPGTSLWVTHAGPMRCLYAGLHGQSVATSLNQPFAYGELLQLR